MTEPDCATTVEQRITQLRHADIHEAVAHLRVGRPDLALHLMYATVEHQARLAGLGHIILLPAPA